MRTNFLSKFLYVCLASAVLAIFSGTIFAQSDLGTINGTVRDPSGAAVPNATVTVKNQANGSERSATTNQGGLYSVTNIPPGMYNVSVTASGFKKFESSNNKLDPASYASGGRYARRWGRQPKRWRCRPPRRSFRPKQPRFRSS